MIDHLGLEKEGLHLIADLYGFEHQKIKAIEEMSELTKAICKQDTAGIVEEIADVTVMMDQLVYLLDCREQVEQTRFNKVYRETMRMRQAGLLKEDKV